MSSGVTTSLSLTFIVMLGIGFAVMNMTQSLSDQLHQSLNLVPHTLVQCRVAAGSGFRQSA